ncbi:uncharacterized protein LOC125929797 isoform X2 [Panthera uncia]|uniref:uncharacterized protein LOC125929797 isoform X2 n=1 Tax=Panthera uncia TaxID=29064 RepID=UPI0020FFBECF|nr:uncharacterized protein LOC125929797 isoform X2 [Panthera uncia]
MWGLRLECRNRAGPPSDEMRPGKLHEFVSIRNGENKKLFPGLPITSWHWSSCTATPRPWRLWALRFCPLAPPHRQVQLRGHCLCPGNVLPMQTEVRERAAIAGGTVLEDSGWEHARSKISTRYY